MEGRERGGYFPNETGVGWTGKAPAPVPDSTLRALGVNGFENLDTLRPPQEMPKGYWGVSLKDLPRRDGVLVPFIVTKCTEVMNTGWEGKRRTMFLGISDQLFELSKGGKHFVQDSDRWIFQLIY